MIALFVIAAAAISVPIAVAVLVSIASRREDSARTIAGTAPCQLTALARRVLSFQAHGIQMPVRPWDAEPVRRPAWYGSTDDEYVEDFDEETLALPTRV
jgi:hypothetical protein